MKNYKLMLWVLVSIPCHAATTCQVWQKVSGTTCITCADGEVVSTTNTQECTPCPDGTIRGNYAGNGASDCVPASSSNGCGLHQKAIKGKCVTCSDGWVATIDYKNCEVCPPLTVRGNYAGNGPGGCVSGYTICGAHQNTQDGKCATCVDGQSVYATNACSVCPDGTVRGNYAGNGAGGCMPAFGKCGLHQLASGGKCVTCSDGWRATSDYKSCEVCPDGTIRGNYAGNGPGGCIPPSSPNGCGLHQKAIGGKCVTCKDGWIANDGYTDCVECPAGTIRGNYAGNGAGGCALPSISGGCGLHQQASGGKCVTCSDGWRATSDYKSCEVCPDGTIRGNYAGNGPGGCIPPSSPNGCGLHQQASGGKCVTCSDGWRATNDYKSCEVCPDGTIRGNYAGNGPGGCIPPSSPNGCGLHQIATGGKCVTCKDGWIANDVYTTCVECPVGTIRGNYAGNGPGGCALPSISGGCGLHQKASGGKCVTCSDGYRATSDYTDCEVCPDGTVRGNAAGNAAKGCESAKLYCAAATQIGHGGKCSTCTPPQKPDVNQSSCISRRLY